MTHSEREQSITETLMALDCGVESPSRGTWRLSAEDGTVAIDARLDESWLALSAPVRATAAADGLWEVLERCSSLESLSKAAVDPGGNRLDVHVDVPVEESTNLVDACRSAVREIVSARRVLLGHREEGGGQEAVGSSPASPEALDVLKERCDEAGWPYEERDGGELRVELSDAQGTGWATVKTFGEESYRACVPLARHKTLGPVGRTAVAVCLLTTNAIVRFARTGVTEGEDRIEFFGEVCGRVRPTAVVLDHAFSALSVVRRLCGKEIRVLGDEAVARAYLDVRGWSPHERSPARQGKRSQTRKRR